MVEHQVLFKIKGDATEAQIDEMMKAIRTLQDKIEGIVDLSAGENFSERSQGFTHGVTVRFTDTQALENYLPHPAHQDVVENNIKPILDEIIVVDYEF